MPKTTEKFTLITKILEATEDQGYKADTEDYCKIFRNATESQGN